ncbi:contact-dependent growth inhibition system immunity protein [Variovorax sp. CCNWLW186]|uniref:contact-dependent growth inhibition system immunity protein n=1 Tax=Variovorax sp. CCNWLW186 TaxID=3127473 RepID=UPI003076F885
MIKFANESPAATIFFNGDFYCVVSMSNSGLHFADPEEPVRYYEFGVDSEILGEGVRQALLASKKIPPNELKGVLPIVKKKVEERIASEMKTYGYKDKRALYQRMIACSVGLNNQALVFYPNHHSSLDGYKGISNDGPEVLRLPLSSSNAEIGVKAKEGLRRCTTAPEFELPVVL